MEFADPIRVDIDHLQLNQTNTRASDAMLHPQQLPHESKIASPRKLLKYMRILGNTQ